MSSASTPAVTRVSPVSVVMGVHRVHSQLREAIVSVLQQCGVEFELIVVANGVNRLAVCEFVSSLGDSRIRIVESEMAQLSYALNRGIELAKFEYIARMDADDIMMPMRLSVQSEFLDQNPHVAVAGTWYTEIDDVGMHIGRSSPSVTPNLGFMKFFRGIPLAHPSVMIRRSAIVAVGGYLGSFLAQDFELWLRMDRRGYVFANLPMMLMYYRRHALQETQSTLKDVLHETLVHSIRYSLADIRYLPLIGFVSIKYAAYALLSLLRKIERIRTHL